jgi:hypothetical protein
MDQNSQKPTPKPTLTSFVGGGKPHIYWVSFVLNVPGAGLEPARPLLDTGF